MKTRKFGIIASYFICDYKTVLKNAGAIISDGIIVNVDSSHVIKNYCKKEKIELIDESDNIIFPGFVNAHTHMYGVYSHGIPNPTNNFKDFLSDYWWPVIENRIRKNHIIAATRVAAEKYLETGVTCICDTLEAPLAEDDVLETEYEIIREYGIKGILSSECCERINRENGYKVHSQNINFAQKHKNDSVRGIVCSHTTFTCSDDFIKHMKKDSEDNHIMWQFHLSEGDFEPQYNLNKHNMLPVEYLDSLNVLGENVLASQCVSITDKEIDILAERGVKVVHMPLSNCEVGAGVAPIPKMLDRNITVALGSDGYVDDFFAIMRAAFLFHKANNKDAQVMPADIVFKMATQAGAEALGFGNMIGCLKEGYCADMIVYRDKFPTPVIESNIFDQLILQGSSAYIKDVYTDGILRNVINTNASDNLKKSVEEFWHYED